MDEWWFVPLKLTPSLKSEIVAWVEKYAGQISVTTPRIIFEVGERRQKAARY